MDKRGDVGSWVREAALKLGADLFWLAATDTKASGDGTDTGVMTLAQVDAAEPEGARPQRLARLQGGEHALPPPQMLLQLQAGEQREATSGNGWQSGLVGRFLAAAVKQAIEKIDRLRGVAGETLCALLYGGDSEQHPPLHSACVPEAEALRQAVEPGVNWQAASEGFPRLLPLLQTTTYHYPLLAGLVISVGGLTESTMKIGREQILQQLEEAELIPMKQMIPRIAASFIQLFREYHATARVIIPALKTVEFLLESMVGLENVDVGQYPFECGSSFGAELVQLCRGEVRASPKDIHLLLAINGTLSASLVFEQPTRNNALSLLLMLLCHRYPKIRMNAAETLFTQITTIGDELELEEEVCTEVGALLEATHWENPVKEVRSTRNAIVEKLGLPAIKSPSSS